jgi:hypothetical protein
MGILVQPSTMLLFAVVMFFCFSRIRRKRAFQSRDANDTLAHRRNPCCDYDIRALFGI